MFTTKKSIALALVLASTLISPLRAEEQWKHTLAPLYLWASGLEGTTQLGPVSAPVSIKFEDAADNLDSGLTLHYEANKGNIGFLADVYYLKLTPESVLPNGAPVGVDLSNTILEVGGIYRPDFGNGLEFLYGLRSTKLEVEAGIGVAPKSTLTDQDWLDAFVGLRQAVSITENTSFTVRGDVGAGDSDFVWNLALLADYRFNKSVSIFGGYRFLDYNYDQGTGANRFAYDVTYEGPAIALRFDWSDVYLFGHRFSGLLQLLKPGLAQRSAWFKTS